MLPARDAPRQHTVYAAWTRHVLGYMLPMTRARHASPAMLPRRDMAWYGGWTSPTWPRIPYPVHGRMEVCGRMALELCGHMPLYADACTALELCGRMPLYADACTALELCGRMPLYADACTCVWRYAAWCAKVRRTPRLSRFAGSYSGMRYAPHMGSSTPICKPPLS